MSNSYALLVTPCPWRTCRSSLKLEVSRPPSQMEYLQLDRVECNLKREDVCIMSARRKDGKGVKQGIFGLQLSGFGRSFSVKILLLDISSPTALVPVLTSCINLHLISVVIASTLRRTSHTKARGSRVTTTCRSRARCDCQRGQDSSTWGTKLVWVKTGQALRSETEHTFFNHSFVASNASTALFTSPRVSSTRKVPPPARKGGPADRL